MGKVEEKRREKKKVFSATQRDLGLEHDNHQMGRRVGHASQYVRHVRT